MNNIKNNFKSIVVYTTLLDKEKTVVTTILYDFDSSHGDTDKDYLKFIFNHIRQNKDIIHLDVKTENQHYLMQSIQKTWDDHIILHNENDDHIVSGVRDLKDVSNKKILQTLSCTDNIGSANDTFTVFNDNSIIYNENGIVDIFEQIIVKLKNIDVSKLSNLEIKILSYFSETSLRYRIEKIKEFSKLVFEHVIENNQDDIYFNLDVFIVDYFDSQKTSFIRKIKSPKYSISLNNEWVVNFYLPSFEKKCYERKIFNKVKLLPINKNIGLFITDDEDLYEILLERLKDGTISPFFIMVNAIIIEIDRIYQLADNESLIGKYFKNTKIGVPSLESFEILDDIFSDMHGFSLKQLPKNYSPENLSDKLYDLMRFLDSDMHRAMLHSK